MALLRKKGWHKLRRARISITLNTIEDTKLKIAVAKDILKQIDSYMDNYGLKATDIPSFNPSKKPSKDKGLFLLSKKKYLLTENQNFLNDKITSFKSKTDYRYKWLGDVNQLKGLFKILRDEKFDCINIDTPEDDWLSNFVDASGIPYNSNNITKLIFNKGDVYLARILHHLFSKSGNKKLIYEIKHKWEQANKIFCKPNHEPFKDLAQTLSQCKIDGKLKTPHDTLRIILKEIDLL